MPAIFTNFTRERVPDYVRSVDRRVVELTTHVVYDPVDHPDRSGH
jgi:hypothetical protein